MRLRGPERKRLISILTLLPESVRDGGGRGVGERARRGVKSASTTKPLLRPLFFVTHTRQRTGDGHHAQVRVVAQPLHDLVGPVLDETADGGWREGGTRDGWVHVRPAVVSGCVGVGVCVCRVYACMHVPGGRDDEGLLGDALPGREAVLEERVQHHDALQRLAQALFGWVGGEGEGPGEQSKTNRATNSASPLHCLGTYHVIGQDAAHALVLPLARDWRV